MSAFIQLLRAHKGELERLHGHELTTDMRCAISALLRCKTEQQGRSQWYCAHCHHDDRLPLSCGHRHCPQCQQRTTADWLQRQHRKLLPVHYFMVTLTLPYQLRVLARYQPKALYQTMFHVGTQLLKDFAHHQQQGELGFTAVLHTHSRQRNLHPHLHIIVPTGRYDASKQAWHRSDKRYLFNAFALAKVWRARMLEAINQSNELWLPMGIPKQWVVDCRRVGYGKAALDYLSRYLYQGVLPDRDILRTSDHKVTFRYRDGQSKQWHTRTLPTLQFLLLILQHVLPKGLQRVRDYGYLRGSASELLKRIQLALLPLFYVMPTIVTPIRRKATRPCPCCQHDMDCVGITRPR
ncbi:transposase [Vibrio breoganii]|uniref:IS91 family transposase n=1 Tax=Vibrio breoganii TaxID=553239 RepID=UPI000C85B671|nr:transposase [Vibrio breoganii]PMP05267.1 transposase [Vibrio breoganii]